jgi:hypothetical protein
MAVTGMTFQERFRSVAGFQDRAMIYYCATGAHMEYVTERDLEDSKTKSLFYPLRDLRLSGGLRALQDGARGTIHVHRGRDGTHGEVS